MNKSIDKWTHQELLEVCNRRLFDALIVGGANNMKGEMHNVFNIMEQWITSEKRKK